MSKSSLSLALVLHAAAIAGTSAGGDAINTNIKVLGPVHQHQRQRQRQRSLSLSLLNSFLMTTPKVDRCRAAMDTSEIGEETPAILCDFIVPKHYNSTASIRFGPCLEHDEPVCDQKAEDDSCIGQFITSGKIRTTIHPDFHREELSYDSFDHTYCARADVYQDTDGSGRQTLIAEAKRELRITFTNNGGNTFTDGSDNSKYSVEMEKDTSSQSSRSTAALLGSLIGIALVIPMVAFFLLKKRNNGGTKIQNSMQMEEDEDDDKSKGGGIEIV